MTDIMERSEGMDFEEYKEQRRKLNKAIKRYCKGRLAYVSSTIDSKGNKRTGKQFEGNTEDLK